MSPEGGLVAQNQCDSRFDNVPVEITFRHLNIIILTLKQLESVVRKGDYAMGRSPVRSDHKIRNCMWGR